MLRRYLFLVIGIILLIAVPLTVSQSLRNLAVRAIHPIGSFFTSRNIALKNSWQNIKDIGNIREQRSKLQQQVIDLQQQTITNAELQQENEALRKELGVTGVTRDMPKVLGRIVLQGDNPLDYSFTIDVGRAQGVKIGQPAISQGALIGRVIEVREQSAIVRAITSLQSGIQAVLISNQEKGYLVGTGNGVTLREISQGVAAAPGTTVATSGLGGSLPQGILIGSIDSLLSEKSELSQTFRVTIPVDPLTVQSLFIILTDTL